MYISFYISFSFFSHSWSWFRAFFCKHPEIVLYIFSFIFFITYHETISKKKKTRKDCYSKSSESRGWLFIALSVLKPINFFFSLILFISGQYKTCFMCFIVKSIYFLEVVNCSLIVAEDSPFIQRNIFFFSFLSKSDSTHNDFLYNLNRNRSCPVILLIN